MADTWNLSYADAGGPYKFPLDNGSQLKSRITFQAIQVTPPILDFKFAATSTANDISGVAGGAIKDVVSTVDAITATKIEPIKFNKVSLYLPIALQVTDGFQYDAARLGSLGGPAAELMNSGQGITGGFMGAADAGIQGFKDFFGLFMGSDAVTRLAIARGSAKIPLGIGDAVQITARITLNPNLRTKFTGTNLREFQFNFKLIPKSQAESYQIKNIVKFFRLHAYPDGEPPGSEFSVALNYPNMFKIRLQSGTNGIFNTVGTPLKYCYLRNVSVIYNPTTPVLHQDGAPTEVDINLSFMEYKTLRRRDIRLENSEAFYNEQSNDALLAAMQNQQKEETQAATRAEAEAAAKEEAKDLGFGVN